MANVKNNASAKETKRRLIEAAGEVFAAHGFERATIKEITDRAGASVAAVNYHFSDKQELYDQVVEYLHERGCRAFEKMNHLDPSLTPAERLRAFIDDLVRNVLDPTVPEWHRLLKAREMQNPSPVTERIIREEFCPYTRRLEQAVQDYVGREVPQPELTRLVNSIVGQCVFYAHSREMLVRLYPDQPPVSETAAELSAHITQFTLAALSCWKSIQLAVPAAAKSA